MFVLTLPGRSWPSGGRRGARAAATSPRSPSSRSPDARWSELLDGLVPGLPDELRGQILARAEGVPLYAVETVRMLLDRGLLAREGDVYRPTGQIEALEVPETLHALDRRAARRARAGGAAAAPGRVGARQDVHERRASGGALRHVRGASSSRCSPSLVRKEVLSRPGRPALARARPVRLPPGPLRQVAYETLCEARAEGAPPGRRRGTSTRRSGRTRTRSSRSSPRTTSTPTRRTRGRGRRRDQGAGLETLARAGERAASLAANEEAQRYFAQAAELTDDPLVEAALRERAGAAALRRGRVDGGARALRARGRALRGGGRDACGGARAGAARRRRVAHGQLEQALERMEAAYAVLSGDEPDEDLATLAAELGRALLLQRATSSSPRERVEHGDRDRRVALAARGRSRRR